MSFPSGARAAVGRALLSSHHGAEQRSCLAVRTPLRAVCCFRRIRRPLASGASSWFPWEQMACLRPIVQLRMQSDADRCYIAVIQLPRRVSPAAGCRASFCWRNPPCRWTQPCQVVEFNYQFMSKVCYIFNMNWEWSSRHRGRCRMAHKTLMARAKLNPLTEHIHAFLCF